MMGEQVWQEEYKNKVNIWHNIRDTWLQGFHAQERQSVQFSRVLRAVWDSKMTHLISVNCDAT